MRWVRGLISWLRRKVEPQVLEATIAPPPEPPAVTVASTKRQEARAAVRQTMAHQIDVAHRSVTMRLARRLRPASRPPGAPD